MALKFDHTTEAHTTVDYPHHETHEGSAFNAIFDVTLGVGAVANLLVVTPAQSVWNGRAHVEFSGSSDDNMILTFHEDADYAGGTAVVAYNRRRDSSKTSNLTITSDSTDQGGGTGTELWHGTAGAFKEVSDTGSGRHEWILAPNSRYLLFLAGANGDVVALSYSWYEHTDVYFPNSKLLSKYMVNQG